MDGTSLPPVTVLIPAYNLEAYIGEAIFSAARQDYTGRVFIIVLDDGSTDQTLAAAKSAAEDFPNVAVHTQSNQGRVGARNRLLSLATTELVAWIDGDDMASPRWINDQVSMMIAEPNLAAVSGQGYALTAAGFPICPIDRPLSHQEIVQLHLAGHSNAFFQSCTLVRKSFVLAAGGYRIQYPISEDYDLWLRLSELGELKNHHDYHLYYRVHSTSANATQSVQQRQQGLAIVNEARSRRGLELLEPNSASEKSDPKKEDWDRQVYWTNLALKSGNPLTAMRMALSALRNHPTSLLIWILLGISCCDSVLFQGNCTTRFSPGAMVRVGQAPSISVYRLARRLVALKRRVVPDAF